MWYRVVRWRKKFCQNDWLVVHHIDIDTWHRYASCMRVYGGPANLRQDPHTDPQLGF